MILPFDALLAKRPIESSAVCSVTRHRPQQFSTRPVAAAERDAENGATSEVEVTTRLAGQPSTSGHNESYRIVVIETDGRIAGFAADAGDPAR